ncbi:MAG: hypothetical protein K2Y56_20115 [Methylobacterium sp.]|uniref:hypothetical protein n=1 Tax=Methylobacterium sp. TaxID=409 RepID=UPI0025E964BA|nr:hypothetical protein [Methylobacterium sp.]MBX9933793.1 hypothetical protein [Methylobacterium sp.]
MAQIETDGRPRPAQGQALVPYGATAERVLPLLRGRPLAGFLAQLIVSTDPALRPSRGDRTRVAAARYAATARVGA